MKKIIATILATLTGCNVTNEKPVVNASDIINSVFENSTASTTTSTETSTVEDTTSTEASTESTTDSTTTSTVETPTESTLASTSKVENKPEAPASSTSTSKPAEKPASSSTTSKPSTPASSSTTTSSSKPAEKPAETTPKHNCSTDGHIWKITYTTTEPKWHRESHIVTSFGFDKDLAQRLYPNISDTHGVYIDTLLNIGVNGAAACGSTDVEVWATETYETKVCTECGYTILPGDAVYSFTPLNVTSENPLGVWRFKNDVNPDAAKSNLFNNFTTIHYDPYNVPQEVINNINNYWKTVFESIGW